MPQFKIKAPDGTIHKVNAPEGATEQDAISYLVSTLAPQPVKREVGVGEAFGQGFERGKSRFASTITDTIPALVGGALGFDEYAEAQLAEANQKAEALSRSAPAVFDSYKDVKGIGDAVKFIAESAGEQLPNMGLAVATALTGGATAPALLGGRAVAAKAVTEAAKVAAAKTVASQAAKGTAAGAFLGSYALNAPEIFQNIYEETGEVAAGTSLLFGSAAAALDSILPQALANNLTGPLKKGIVGALLKRSGMSTGALRGAAAGLTTGVVSEFATEGAQEGISIAAERFIDDNPEVFGSREWDRIMEASVRGAAAGGAYGTAGGAAGGAREKSALVSRLQNMQEAKTLREATEAKQNRNSEEEGITDQLELEGLSTGLNADQRNRTIAEFERAEGQDKRKEEAENEPFNLVKNGEFTSKAAVGLDAALTEARRLKALGNTFYESIPNEGTVESLTTEQKELVETVQQDLSERVLLADAAEYARLRDIPFDANKRRTDLNPEEREVFEIVSRTRYQKLGGTQSKLPGVKATVAAQEKADIKQAETEAKAATVAVNKAERERKAELKARSKGINTQEGLDFGNLNPEAEANPLGQDQLDLFNATSSVSTTPLKGQVLNRYIRALGLKATAANRAIFADKVMILAENRKAVVKKLYELAERSKSGPAADTYDAAAKKIQGVNPETVVDPLEDVATDAEIKAQFDSYNPTVDPVNEGANPETTDPTLKPIFNPEESAPEADQRKSRETLINMTPDEFLGLAEDLPPTQVREESETFLREQIANGETLEIPYLMFQVDNAGNATVVGHEGRHRARILKEMDETQMPVRFISIGDNSIRWSEQSSSTSFDRLASPWPTTLSPQKGSTGEAITFPVPDPISALLPNKTPAVKGKPLSAKMTELIFKGANFNAVLDALIPTLKGPSQRLMRKIRSQNLTPTIEVAPTETGTTGYYNAKTNTIGLNPTDGLTEGTFIHEAMHASLAQALNNPNLAVTKELFAFFSDIQASLYGFYGGTNMQEFAAELAANQQLIALLKGMKPPKGNQSYLGYIADIIARFFGFRKDQTAYTEAVRLVENVLDIAQDVEPTLDAKLFNGTPAMGNSAMGELITTGSTLVGNTKENLRETISRLTNDAGAKSLLSKAMSFLRLNDLIRLYDKKLPQLVDLRDAILGRQGRTQAGLARIQKNYRKFKKIAKAAGPKKLKELGDIASAARRGRFDLVGIHKEFDPSKLSATEKAEFTALSNRLRNLDKTGELQGMYKDIVMEYKDAYTQLLKFTFEGVKAGKQKDILIQEFTNNNPIIGYVPFRHPGDYFVKYKDMENVTFQVGFETNDKRKEFINANRATIQESTITTTDRMEEVSFDGTGIPSGSFVAKLMRAVDTQSQKDQIYQVMLSMYPDSSFMQRTRKGKEVGGENRDLLQGYSETALRFNSKLANLEYAPKVEAALEAIKEAGTKRTDLESGTIQAVANEIGKRSGFIRSPSYPRLTGFLTTAAYNLYLLGSVSAAVVNLSAIIMLGLPKLAAEFTFGSANSEMLKAMKVAGRRGDKNWALDKRYKTLVETLDEFGQREHTLQKELQDGANASVEGFDSKWENFLNMLSWPFTAAERYSRATVAITAYELSLASGKSEQEASVYARQVVMDVHTTGMAAEGPRLAQGAIGRVMFTFKSWIWNSAVQTAFAANESVKGADPEVRRKARSEIIGIYGMSATVAGVNGLPFFGAAATFANIVAALIPDDEEEPFNARSGTREFVGDFAFKGPLNWATNLEISNRTGIANGLLFREDPYSIEQNGYVLTAIMQAMGPVLSYTLGVTRGASKLLAAGEYSRFMETIMPSAARNVLKAGRYYYEGARTIDGAPIDTDINGYNLFMQAFGFTPADLSNTYEKRSDAANYESKVLARKQKILKKYYIGATTGDMELANEAAMELMKFAQRYPALVKSNTLSSSFKSRQSYEQKLIAGLKFNDALTPELNERFFDD